jgi:hypothetical protein
MIAQVVGLPPFDEFVLVLLRQELQPAAEAETAVPPGRPPNAQ